MPSGNKASADAIARPATNWMSSHMGISVRKLEVMERSYTEPDREWRARVAKRMTPYTALAFQG